MTPIRSITQKTSIIIGLFLFLMVMTESWTAAKIFGALMLLRIILTKPKILLPSQAVTLLGLINLLWLAASAIWSVNLNATLTEFNKVIFFYFLAVVSLNEDSSGGQNLLNGIALTAFAVSAGWLFSPKIQGVIVGPSSFAGFLAVGGILCVGLALQSRKLIYALAGFVICFAVFLFASMGPIIALLSGMTYLLIKSFRSNPALKKPILIAAFTLSIVLFKTFIPYTSNPFYNLQPPADSTAGSPPFSYYLSSIPFQKNRLHHIWERRIEGKFSSERLIFWQDSLKMFLQHKWAGIGLGNYPDYYPEYKTIIENRVAPHAHSEPLQFLIERGVIGFALVMFLAITLFNSLKTPQGPSDPIFLWKAGIIGMLAQSLADCNFRFLTISIFLALGVGQILRPEMEWSPSLKTRRVIGVFVVFLTLLFALPGAAHLTYQRGHKDIARLFDPMNSGYWASSGRMRDLDIALMLEPRNVWFHQKAADFYSRDWEQSHRPGSLDCAHNHYKRILALAPTADFFQKEYLDWLKRYYEKR